MDHCIGEDGPPVEYIVRPGVLEASTPEVIGPLAGDHLSDGSPRSSSRMQACIIAEY